jgi:hypothetical protein
MRATAASALGPELLLTCFEHESQKRTRSSGVSKEAFKDLHALGSGAFTKVEAGHADTFELKPDEAGKRYLRDRVQAGGTILIVAVPEDEEVAATYFGAGPNRTPIGHGWSSNPRLGSERVGNEEPQLTVGMSRGGWCNPGCNRKVDL